MFSFVDAISFASAYQQNQARPTSIRGPSYAQLVTNGEQPLFEFAADLGTYLHI
jgi:hypothetical protein